jgi:hypothetical protein
LRNEKKNRKEERGFEKIHDFEQKKRTAAEKKVQSVKEGKEKTTPTIYKKCYQFWFHPSLVGFLFLFSSFLHRRNEDGGIEI